VPALRARHRGDERTGEWMQAVEQADSGAKSTLREFVETLLLTVLIYVLVRTFLFENYRVVGHSMDPTLEDNQYLAVNKLVYRLHKPQRGDIIVFRDPRSDGRKLIKRVIALPGEVVEIDDGQVFIDGQLLDEPYIQVPGRYSYQAMPLPADEYFVLGDNRNNSSDSHSWGLLPRSAIVGKAWISYWPPALWGLISHESYDDAS
jgi:signal peptidase I